MERQHWHLYLEAEGEGSDLPHRSMRELRSPKSHRAVMLPKLKVLVVGFLLLQVGVVVFEGFGWDGACCVKALSHTNKDH